MVMFMVKEEKQASFLGGAPRLDIPIENVFLRPQIEHWDLVQWGIDNDGLSSFALVTIRPPKSHQPFLHRQTN